MSEEIKNEAAQEGSYEQHGLKFKLDVFEGPLDLLLHLIAKHKLNINDIPIIMLVEQYLAYISDMADADMEIAGEFLEMAAHLIYIKTVSLLPKHEEAEVLKKELEGRLIEYSLCKIAAENMRSIYIGDTITVKKQMKLEVDMTYTLSHEPSELLDAYLGMSVKKTVREEITPQTFSKLVSRKFVSVTSKIISVLRKLYKDGKCSFAGLFEDMTDRSERVATFLAVLELTKSGRIILNDDNTEMTFNRNHIRHDEDDTESEESYDEAQ